MLSSGPPELPGFTATSGLDERDRVQVRVAGEVLAALRAHDARGDRVLEAEGRADGHDPFADAKLRGVADLHDRQARRLDLDHGDVAARVRADELRLELALVGKAHVDLFGVLDDVRVGDDEAVLGDDEPGAQAEGAKRTARGAFLPAVATLAAAARGLGLLVRAA
jgi:hypothetical protein